MLELIRRRMTLLALVGAAFALSACGYGQAVYPEKQKGDSSPTLGGKPRETIFGEGGLGDIFGGGNKSQDDQGGGGIGVNSFLWRASLDTMGFMPLSSADPFGGVILTDWYVFPESPGERFKATVLILGRSLRADGVRVTLFKQLRDPVGNWIDAPVDPKMGTDLENAILNRARQLRLSQDQ